MSLCATLLRLTTAAAAVTLLTNTALAQPEICPDGGLIVFEVEAADPAPGWIVETSEAGFTGDSYYHWVGGNNFFTPGEGIITYTINVEIPGTYQLRIRNLHLNPDFTLENDCWTRWDGGEWLKCYSNIAGSWTFSSWYEYGSFNDRAEVFLTAGQHTLEISGRSNGFRIDRVHLYRSDVPAPVNENATFPPTTCVELWEDLGNGLAGTGGITPVLEGSGDLTDNAVTTLSLTQARANAAAYVFVGFTEVNVPFKFGVLVPNPDLIVGPVNTNAQGELELSALWPAGTPSGFETFWQEWVQDPAGPAGFSASNAVKSTTP